MHELGSQSWTAPRRRRTTAGVRPSSLRMLSRVRQDGDGVIAAKTGRGGRSDRPRRIRAITPTDFATRGRAGGDRLRWLFPTNCPRVADRVAHAISASARLRGAHDATDGAVTPRDASASSLERRLRGRPVNHAATFALRRRAGGRVHGVTDGLTRAGPGMAFRTPSAALRGVIRYWRGALSAATCVAPERVASRACHHSRSWFALPCAVAAGQQGGPRPRLLVLGLRRPSPSHAARRRRSRLRRRTVLVEVDVVLLLRPPLDVGEDAVHRVSRRTQV